MTALAVCEPISWLRLERYHLGELSPAEREAIGSHLDVCDRCRACLDQIRAPAQAEPRPLPAAALASAPGDAFAPAARRPPPRAASGSTWLGLGFLATAAVLLILIVARPTDAPTPGRGRLHIATKGGEVTLELIREHDGSTAYEPSAFTTSDRFEVLLTCPPPLRLFADLAIVQDDGVAFPGQPSAISCGNRVALAIPFRITGPGAAAVCIAVDPVEPPARERLRALRTNDAGLGDEGHLGCIHLAHAPD